MASKPPTDIVDQLSTLVGERKGKNEEMDICVCQITPTLQSDTLQAKINEISEQIQR